MIFSNALGRSKLIKHFRNKENQLFSNYKIAFFLTNAVRIIANFST